MLFIDHCKPFSKNFQKLDVSMKDHKSENALFLTIFKITSHYYMPQPNPKPYHKLKPECYKVCRL